MNVLRTALLPLSSSSAISRTEHVGDHRNRTVNTNLPTMQECLFECCGSLNQSVRYLISITQPDLIDNNIKLLYDFIIFPYHA